MQFQLSDLPFELLERIYGYIGPIERRVLRENPILAAVERSCKYECFRLCVDAVSAC